MRRSAVSGAQPALKRPAADDTPVAPTLRPPGSRPGSGQPATSPYRRVGIALAVTVALAVAVVAALPHLVGVSGDRPAVDAAVVSTPEPPESQQQDPAARSAAEQDLREFLRLRARLELAGAERWGEPDWSRAAGEAVEGDQMFARQRFAAAAQQYGAARQTLETLEAGRDQRLAAALEAGQRALQTDDAAAAQAGFERALLIEPDHPQASQGLSRARVRDQVSGLMGEAGQSEQGGELEAARSAYQEALQLDPDYAPATTGLQRVEQRLADNAFRLAMSETLAALDSGRLAAAQRSLDQAAAVKPDDHSVQDARQRLARARQAATLKRLRAEATARVRGEDWSVALDLYRQALALQPGAAFARQGSTRAEQRARLHAQLDDYLADPARLHAPEPLAGAERLLAAVAAAPDAEPRLAAKLATLQSRVEQATTPVRVTLHSDGETEVVIYHVGRLGRFQVHELQLRPGTYTAVGSRPGYRDVRAVFKVQPGTPPQALQLRCEEPV